MFQNHYARYEKKLAITINIIYSIILLLQKERKFMRELLFIVLSMLIFSVQVISPYQVFGSQSSLKDRNSARLTFGKESYVIEELYNSEKETTIKLSAEHDMEGKAKQSIIEVNYETGDFKITDETGKVEKYNVSEFIVEEEEKMTPLNETEQEVIQKLLDSGIFVEDID
ncbi:MAG TPA: hypothetical protein GX525_04800 [Bacilli bacterium]|nr:hypothetical protein [Bacilli bacterium]